MVIPFTPLGTLFGFVPLPALFFAILLAMIVAYLLLVEGLKYFFYRQPTQARQAEARDRLRVGRIASRWID